MSVLHMEAGPNLVRSVPLPAKWLGRDTPIADPGLTAATRKTFYVQIVKKITRADRGLTNERFGLES